jgi:hypothetical protein
MNVQFIDCTGQVKVGNTHAFEYELGRFKRVK